MLDILKDLNPKQKKAVTHTEGPVLILAGAGSGKTRVITYRIVYLVHKGVSPGNILAVTFTNKAAEEMRHRVIDLLGKTHKIQSISNKRTVYYIPLISTFHSFCSRVLRQDIDKIGLRKDFIIYDETEQFDLIKECMKELRIDEKRFKVGLFADAINKAKDELLDCESYQIYTATSGNYYREVISEIYKLYQIKLNRNNALDFGDLIMRTVQLFKENPYILEKYQDRFRYIMVDEYQDTNHAQYILTKLLAQKYKNICVVGDEDQSIYMWRGADMRNILHFEKDYTNIDKPTSVLRMMDNYRSSQNILDVANRLISYNSQRRHDKGLLRCAGTKHIGKEPVISIQLSNEIEEAEYIVNEIKNTLKKRGVYGSDIAIFYRTNAQSRVLEEILRKSKINYKLIGTVEFYERKEIKDILSYMRVIVNPLDSLSLKRIINVPNRGIGKVSSDQLEKFALKEKISLYDALQRVESITHIQESKRKIIKNFLSFIKKFISDAAMNVSVSETVCRLIDEMGYIKSLQIEDTLESHMRIENIKELISAIKEFEERDSIKSIGSFLEQISLIDNLGVIPDTYSYDVKKKDNIAEDSKDKVILMTLHLAKGLEFSYVFISGLEEGLLPHINSMNSEQELEEERRLGYVGMTRAKKQLYLTCVSERRLYGSRRWNIPSRFIFEAGLNFSQLLEPEKQRDSWRVGERVRHPDFGEGKIIEKAGSGDDLKMVVLFNDGQKKKLLAKYAKLQKRC